MAFLCMGYGSVLAQTFDKDWQALTGQFRELTEKNRHIESLEIAKKALTLADRSEKIGGPKFAASYFMMGSAYLKLNQFEKALEYLLKSVSISEKILKATDQNISRLLVPVGISYQKLGQYDKAILINQRVLSIQENTWGEGDSRTAGIINNLADNYRSLGLFDDALLLLSKSLAIAEKVAGPDADVTAVILANMSAIYRDLGQFEKALLLSKRALTIHETSLGPNHADTAFDLNTLGVIYFDLAQYEKAIPLLRRALNVQEEFLGKNHPDVALTLTNLSMAYAAIAQWDKAQQLAQHAIEINENVLGPNHPVTALTLNNLARIYSGQNLYEKSLVVNQRVLDISESALGPMHPLTAKSLNNLADTFLQLGIFEKALPLNERALHISENVYGFNHQEVGQSLFNLAQTLNALGLTKRGLSANERAVSIFVSTLGMDHTFSAMSLNNLAINYATDGQTDFAIVLMKAAVNSYQGQRERVSHLGSSELGSFTTSVAGSYQSLASYLIEQGRLPEAQMVLDMLKEDEQFEFIRRSETADPRRTRIGYNTTEQTLMTRYRQIADRLAALGVEEQVLQKQAKLGLSAQQKQRQQALTADLRVAQAAFQSFLNEMREGFSRQGPARSADVAETSQKNLGELQGLLQGLGHDAVLLQYYVTDDQVGVLLTTPGVQLARSTKVNSKELNRQIAEFRRLLRDPKSDSRPASQALYQLLVAPVAQDLEQTGAKTVMLSLDGALRYLPFGALHDGHRYLVERWNLPMYTSVTKNRLSDAVTPRWQAAGLGVTKAIGGFVPLPAVAEEMNSIVKAGSGGILPGEVYLDGAFTAKRLQDVSRRAFQLLHVASHFQFSPGTEVNSFLLLGDGQQLTLGDIRTQNYRFDNVDLLTLSACDTGLGGGRDAQGREIEGFGVIAQQQGARAVLATLWPVADQSTAKLMAEMYRRRQEQKLTKTEALRQAQLLLLSQSRYAHPFYWAPFILMGNWL